MFAPAIVRSEKEITKRQRLAISRFRGKPSRRVEGSYIDDLAALKKAVWLCPWPCAAKFNRKAYGYVTKRNIPFARGHCDGCSQYHDRMPVFVHHTQVGTL